MRHVNMVENKAVQLNGVIETHGKTVKKNVDEMTFISKKNISDQVKQKELSPLKNQIAVTKISPEELKNAISEGLIDFSHFLPREIDIMNAILNTYNESNKATANVNAKMARMSESLTLNVANDIKTKAIYALGANVMSSTVSAVSGLVSATQSYKANELQTEAQNIKAETNIMEADLRGNPADADIEAAIVNKKEIMSAKLTESAKLSSKADKYKYWGEFKGYSSFLNIGEAAAESTQAIDQNSAEAVNRLYQAGFAESDSNQELADKIHEAIQAVLDNMLRAGDTVAQNC
ncbi:hypothetical protein J4198_005386 [Salmonella enterica]|nr:hypothetical protein [Salmonella enterica]EHG4041548.1 hypothetical protein [Salmonella enterica]EHG6849017.1 hypothetical protein [Salmonella enterica]